MRILQTIGGFRAEFGGTTTCTYDLLSAIHRLVPREHVDILTPDVSGPGESLVGVGERWIKAVPNDYRTPLFLSRNMTNFLRNSHYDIYQTNGMWMHINHSTCSIARSKGRPYIITPHGMLYPEAMARNYWKKWPLRKLWFDKDVRLASAIHATCEEEMHHIRALGYKGPIAVIGNALNIPEISSQLISSRTYKENGITNIGFLGRLHPIKKIENLLRGVAASGIAELKVHLIGKGDDEYEAFLRSEAKRLGLDSRVVFHGFISGDQKYEELAKLDALFVPSDTENFGMIVPEALIVGTPVFASLGTPWKSLNEQGCGWWRNKSPESIAEVIKIIHSMDIEELREMGLRGRKYITKNFADEIVAQQMLSLYRWINNEGEKPECVRI